MPDAVTEETPHVPLIEKHPLVRLSPFANDDVAVVLVILSRFAASPPVKVDVEFIPVTVRMPASVDVAVEVPLNVVKVRGPVNTPAPVTERGVPGVVVPSPRKLFDVSTVRKFAEPRVEIPV